VAKIDLIRQMQHAAHHRGEREELPIICLPHGPLVDPVAPGDTANHID